MIFIIKVALVIVFCSVIISILIVLAHSLIKESEEEDYNYYRGIHQKPQLMTKKDICFYSIVLFGCFMGLLLLMIF